MSTTVRAKTATPPRRAVFVTLLAILSLLFFTIPASIGANSAHAGVGMPAWWNGKECDTNNYPESKPLGASYNGVEACGPGPYNQGGSDHSETIGGFGEYEWECLELVMRYMYLVYNITPYSADGGTVVTNYSGSVLTKVTDVAHAGIPSPGDIVSFTYDHTAVVTDVSGVDANGNGAILTMQQNATSDGVGKITVKNHVLGSSVSGWLHNPNGSPPTASTGRIGTLSPSGTLFVKEGAIDTGWVTMQGNVVQYALSGNRVGIVTSDGTFSLKEGTLDAGWVTMQGRVSKISLSGNRIGIVMTNGDVYVKEGTISAPWVLLAGGGTDIALAGTRIAMIDTSGTLSVKDGSIYSGWVTMQGSVSKMSASPNRIGIVMTNGDVEVKDGSIYSGWVTVYGSSTDISLTDTRIGVLDTSGTLRVKENSIYNGWTTLQGAVTKISLSGNRIGIVTTNGDAVVKDGTVNDPWVTVNGPMASIKVSGT